MRYLATLDPVWQSAHLPVSSSPVPGHYVWVPSVLIMAPILGGARTFSEKEQPVQPPNRQRNQGQRTEIGFGRGD
ncbi:unnamed protein product [Lota lota]